MKFVIEIVEKSIKEGKIHALIDTENLEIIYYEPEEMDNLVKLLNSDRVSIPELANELNLKNDQVELIIDYLIDTGRIKGIYTSDYAFVSDNALKNLIVDLVERTGKIDFHEITRELSIPENKVIDFLKEISRTIIEALVPYRRVRIADLSREIGLPRSFTIFLVKKLISEGQISGTLDMIDGILSIESKKFLVESKKEEIFEEKKIVSEVLKKEIKRSEEPKKAYSLGLIFIGVLIILIGFACLSYRVEPNPKVIQALERQIDLLKDQLTRLRFEYGFNHPFVKEKIVEIQQAEALLEAAKRPIYPYRDLGIIICVVGLIAIGVSLAKAQE